MARKREYISYNASPTSAAFHNDDHFVRGLRGPVGCGKSVACTAEIGKKSSEQEPFNGIRRTRWAVIRNTYNELHTTTLKTWKDWFPEHVCPIKQTPSLTAHMKAPLEDGTQMDMEVIFLALDSPEDMKKLLSLELTGAWVNEAREVPKAIIDGATQRVRRFPPKRDGGPTWTGVIMDTNSPDDDSWWYRIFEKECPKNWRQFVYPPAMFMEEDEGGHPFYIRNEGQRPGILAAENVYNITDDWLYYEDMLGGKDREWIKVYVQNEYGHLVDGRPVYPEYQDHMHVADELEVFSNLPVYMGIDFGNTPAFALFQMGVSGQLRVIDEICSIDPKTGKEYAPSLRPFCNDIVIPHIMNKYHGAQFYRYCDPAGLQKGQTDARTCMQILDECGLPAVPPNTSNQFAARRDSLVRYLRSLDSIGEQAFQLSKKTCPHIRAGLAGKYYFKRVRVAGDERFHDQPAKTKESHVCEGLQYGVMGAHSGAGMIHAGTPNSTNVKSAKRDVVVKSWM